ncbi:MAG: hypothetical protein ACI9JO_001064, partial [Psychrobacter okhotskensis]
LNPIKKNAPILFTITAPLLFSEIGQVLHAHCQLY